MAEKLYKDWTPVDEPTSPEVKKDKPKPAPKQKKTRMDSGGKNVLYPDWTPVDEPTSKYAKGGKVRGGGMEQRGKTRGKFI